LVVSNIGATIARDVHLMFEPKLTSSAFDSTSYPPGDLKAFREGIPSLPPGKRLSILLDTFVERDAAQHSDEYRVSISYRSPTLERGFSDEAVLDLGMYRNVLNLDRKDVHDVHKQLGELVKQAKAIVTALGKIKPADN
jgi:hypothetical protein